MPAACQVNYSAMHYYTVCVGAHSDLLFKITNTGDSGQLAGTVSVPGPDFSIQGTATYDLAPSEEQWFTVRFEPQSAGFKSETVETGNALCADLDVDGTGDDTEICSLNQSSITFGEVEVGSYEESTLRITNTGCGTLSGSVSVASGGDHFSIQESDHSYSLTNGQYADFTIRFEPQEPGIFTGSIETGNAACEDVPLSGSSKDPMTMVYFQYGTGESYEETVYLRHAVITPHAIEHELPQTISRTEDLKLKVYEHGLGGDRKRIWQVTAYIKLQDSEGYRWTDLESFYWETIHGAREQFTFRDNFNHTYTVRMIAFGAPQFETRDLVKIRMVLEEDYE